MSDVLLISRYVSAQGHIFRSSSSGLLATLEGNQVSGYYVIRLLSSSDNGENWTNTGTNISGQFVGADWPNNGGIDRFVFLNNNYILLENPNAASRTQDVYHSTDTVNWSGVYSVTDPTYSMRFKSMIGFTELSVDSSSSSSTSNSSESSSSDSSESSSSEGG